MMSYQVFHARWIFLFRKLGFKKSRAFFSAFVTCTLPLEEKLTLLESMPFEHPQFDMALGVLTANFDFKKVAHRNQEWSDFLDGITSNEYSKNSEEIKVPMISMAIFQGVL